MRSILYLQGLILNSMWTKEFGIKGLTTDMGLCSSVFFQCKLRSVGENILLLGSTPAAAYLALFMFYEALNSHKLRM